MGRRKSRVKLPFLKVKINKKTILNIVGFIFLGAGLVLLLSFAKNFIPIDNGRILGRINENLLVKFGGLSILLPLVLILLSGHFFNTKKLKFIKLNITGGIVLVLLSLLGIFQSGLYGKFIFQNLSLDFSFLGAVIILIVIFVIGLVLFLDTSIDVFLLFILGLFKSFFVFIVDH